MTFKPCLAQSHGSTSLGTLTTIPGRGVGNKQRWPAPEGLQEGNRPATNPAENHSSAAPGPRGDRLHSAFASVTSVTGASDGMRSPGATHTHASNALTHLSPVPKHEGLTAW